MSDRRLARKLELESRLPADERAVQGSRGFNPLKSGLVTAFVLGALLLVFGLLWRAHQQAQFHKFTTSSAPQVEDAPRPGGQEAITLSRPMLLHNTVPEFVSATLLPGLGMQVLQLSVDVPDHGVQTLLAAPSVAEIVNGPIAKPDAGPFELALASQLQASAPTAEVIGQSGATGVTNVTQADGGEATGTFSAVNTFGKPLGLEAKIDTSLTGRSFDIDIHLRNGALASREYSLSWSPRFRAPDGKLSEFVLSVPSNQQLVGGEVRSVHATDLDFSAEQGRTVPNVDLDATFVALQRMDIGEGPAVRLTDLSTGLVLRLVMLTPSIRSVRVRTDTAAHTLTLSFGTDDETQRTTLEAGESAEWRLRVDVPGTGSGAAGTRSY